MSDTTVMQNQEIKIVTELPGPRARLIIEQERKYLATGTKCWETPAVPARGWGVWFEDVDGNVMMDWTNGMCTILGHSHPTWVEAQVEQLRKLSYFNSPDYPNQSQASVAETLCRITPGGWDKKVFFCCSGTEANEASFKVARIGKRRDMIVGFLGGFHGRTAGTLAATASKATQRRHHTAPLHGVVSVPFANCYRCWYKLEYPSCDVHCMKVLERYFQTVAPPENVAAIVYEPVQGEGGYVVPPPGALETLHELARKYDILTIADEVQTGFGKSGTMFATQALGVEPDIISLAKGIGNGATSGASVFPARYDFPAQGMHSNTFGAQIVNSEAVRVTIDELEKGTYMNNVQEVGKLLKDLLLELKDQFENVGDVRSLGFLIGVELVEDRAGKAPARELRDRVIVEAFQRGLLILSCGESTIRITPALTLSAAEARLGVEILRQAMQAAGAGRRSA